MEQLVTNDFFYHFANTLTICMLGNIHVFVVFESIFSKNCQ